MKSKLHGFFGAVALLCIATFWSSTVVSELFLDQASVIAVKNAVLTGMWLLIPTMAATGGSGFSLASRRRGRIVEVKGRRMKVVAANGLFILLPSACARVLGEQRAVRWRVLCASECRTDSWRNKHHAAHAEYA